MNEVQPQRKRMLMQFVSRWIVILSGLLIPVAFAYSETQTVFCQNQPGYTHHGHIVEVRLYGVLKSRRVQGETRLAAVENFRSYFHSLDRRVPQDDQGLLRPEIIDFAFAEQVEADPTYRPRDYVNHARFPVETKQGWMKLIYPHFKSANNQSEVKALLDVKYDRFGTYVPLVCQIHEDVI